MKYSITLLKFLVITMFITTAAEAQIGVAIRDAAGGTAQGVGILAVGTIRTATTVAMAVPVPVATDLVGGVSIVSIYLATSLLSLTATIAENVVPDIVGPAAVATKDISLGLVKAGWHIVFRKHKQI